MSSGFNIRANLSKEAHTFIFFKCQNYKTREKPIYFFDLPIFANDRIYFNKDRSLKKLY